MDWLNMSWIVDNWVPLAVFTLIGFLLGWLIIGSPAGRRASAAEAKVSDAESRARKADRDLADLKRESEPLKANLARVEGEKDTAAARVTALEASVSALEQEKSDLLAILAEQQADAAVLVEEDAAMEAALAAEEAAGPEPVAEPVAELGPVSESTADQVSAQFGMVARQIEPVTAPSSKDIALGEAYARVTVLQRDLADRDQALMQQASELDTTRNELAAAQAVRQELESRLVRSREDVASELAVLASTMIKMKDDALARSEARVQALSAELETLRSASQQATATAD